MNHVGKVRKEVLRLFLKKLSVKLTVSIQSLCLGGILYRHALALLIYNNVKLLSEMSFYQNGRNM